MPLLPFLVAIVVGGLLYMVLARPFDRFPITTIPLVVTSRFGMRTLNGVSGFHAGVDWRAPVGTPLTSIARGRVRTVSNGSRAGLYVEIDGVDAHEGYRWSYMHLSSVAVTVGELVDAGDLVALSGDTPAGTVPHLHLEIHKFSVAIDPLTVLPISGYSFKATA